MQIIPEWPPAVVMHLCENLRRKKKKEIDFSGQVDCGMHGMKKKGPSGIPVLLCKAQPLWPHVVVPSNNNNHLLRAYYVPGDSHYFMNSSRIDAMIMPILQMEILRFREKSLAQSPSWEVTEQGFEPRSTDPKGHSLPTLLFPRAE